MWQAQGMLFMLVVWSETCAQGASLPPYASHIGSLLEAQSAHAPAVVYF